MRVPSLSVILAVTASVAPLAAQRAEPTLRLELVTTFGVLEGRGELGSAGRTVETANGDVLVLDQVNRQVVIFNAKGEYLRAFGRDGEGPGEFRRPARMSAGPDNTVYIYDAQLKRLAHFTAEGKFISQLPLPAASNVTDFVISAGRAWFVRMVPQSGMAVIAFDLARGARVDSFAALSDREVAISSHGAPGSIAAQTSGAITYAGPFPVELRTWNRGTVTSGGTNRIPDARAFTSPAGARGTSVSMRAFAARPDGGFAVVYSTTDVSRDNVPGTLRFWLEMLAADGASRGRAELRDMGFVGGLSVARNGDLLLSVSEEYPQVRRLRVVTP